MQKISYNLSIHQQLPYSGNPKFLVRDQAQEH